ncbi:MAG: EcsC family protein [Firmicutes bacterium]|nr:EcsC family protein [Bacillota bacterium]
MKGVAVAVFPFKKQTAIEKEYAALIRKEARLRRKATKAEPARWKERLEEKVPQKVYVSLQEAFCKAFELVFTKGVGIIERTYDRNAIEEDHAVQDYAVQVKGGRRELKQLRRRAARAGTLNMALTTAEGLGLGVLGIGLPDIVLFVGMLLKGIYETALSYGFAYDTPAERLLILKMMEAALAKGEDFAACDAAVEELLCGGTAGESELPEQIEAQMEKTGSAFAIEMLLLKFVQSFAIIGVLGGAANPLYYNKVMEYVQLKYQKRYLLAAAQRRGIALKR